MKLSETIEACRKLIAEEIEGIEYYIDLPQYKGKESILEEWRIEKQMWNEHLNNLTFIQHETNLNEYDEIIERDS